MRTRRQYVETEPRRCDGIRLAHDLPATDIQTSSGAREREGEQQPEQAERDGFDRGKSRRVRPIISAKRFASRASSSLETDEEGNEQAPEHSGIEGDGHVALNRPTRVIAGIPPVDGALITHHAC